jgi:hypothetical protein
VFDGLGVIIGVFAGFGIFYIVSECILFCVFIIEIYRESKELIRWIDKHGLREINISIGE